MDITTWLVIIHCGVVREILEVESLSSDLDGDNRVNRWTVQACLVTAQLRCGACLPARSSQTAEGPWSDMACRAARSLEQRGAAAAALNCRPTHYSLSVPLIRTQHGANQADRSQVHRRQSPPQAAGHKGCPQVRPSQVHRRRGEAPPLQVRRAPRAPLVLHAPFAHLLSLTLGSPLL